MARPQKKGSQSFGPSQPDQSAKSSEQGRRAMGGPRRRGSVRSAEPANGAALTELRALYARIDRELHGWGCDASTDCCRFGVTGREPYPTAVEIAELERAVRARGGLPKRRSLPQSDERRCDLLGDDGRCLVYASRPFGCRTFFCERGHGPVGERADKGLPRGPIAEVGRDIAALSDRFAPADPGPRPLSRVSRNWSDRRSRS
jgi:Fe-S-cluster containining protein